MAQRLESPAVIAGDWGELYRARGEEVSEYRPIFTGDVFADVPIGNGEYRTVILAIHPCALRVDGVNLVESVVAYEVEEHQLLRLADWQGHAKVMPLPALAVGEDGTETHFAAKLTKPCVVKTGDLANRIASLSAIGIDLLLQRWVHHNSRVVISSDKFFEVIGGVFEEADIMEEWCAERSDIGKAAAAVECMQWLRAKPDGQVRRQEMLESAQSRSTVRRQMTAELKRLADSP